MKKAVIIGAGIGGLATSIRLASRGLRVSVFEGNSTPGGKLSEISSKGYRFDFGPSLFTLPKLVDELYQICGLNPRNHFEYQRLSESCKYFYEDGLNLIAYAEQEKLYKELSSKTGVSISVIKRYFDHSKMIFDATKPVFLEKSLHKTKSFLTYDTIKAMSKVYHYDLFDSMHSANTKRVKEPHLVQFLDRYATYNGSNPYKAPGILNLIPTLEHLEGSYFPKGGMYSIAKSLEELAKHMGVNFHYNSPVDQILLKGGLAKGIRVNNTNVPADIVVSNMDVYLTYSHLLDGYAAPKKSLRQERSSSALVFYWGINNSFPQLGLHNIFFSGDYEREFESIFEKKDIYSDPTVYINITSKLNPADAPTGHENWFVMVNAPSIDDQNWEEITRTTKRNVLGKLSRMLKTDIEAYIDFENITDPLRIQSKTRSHLGSLYGTSSNSKMAAFLRHPNFNRKVDNLFFCGGSVHPGGGIPLCLMSAKIVESLIS